MEKRFETHSVSGVEETLGLTFFLIRKKKHTLVLTGHKTNLYKG